MRKIIQKIKGIKLRSVKLEYVDPRNIDWKKLSKEEMERNFRKALRSPYLYISLGLLVGILFTFQFKTESKRPLNPVLFYNELVDIKDDFFIKQQDLNKQIKEIQREIAENEKSLANKNYISNTLYNSLTEQELVFGSVGVEGRGIIVSLSDGVSQVRDEFSKSLAHAADLRDIVNLLWYAGAEAISINGERVIYNTSIDCLVNTIVINNNNYVSPFAIKAIGNKYDLYNILNNSRKLIDIKKRAAKNQIDFDIQMQDNIKIGGYSGIYSNL